MSNDEYSIRLRLSAQTALLGAIGKGVTAVYILYEGDIIILQVFSETNLLEAERQALLDASVEIHADFYPSITDVNVTFVENAKRPFSSKGFGVFSTLHSDYYSSFEEDK